MEKKDLDLLNQLIDSLEQYNLKLEESLGKKDIEQFNKIKKSMIKLQNEIENILIEK